MAFVVTLILCFMLFFLTFTIKLFVKLWLNPNRIRRWMYKQGIKGPSYIFIHGSTKEISSMKKEAMTKPLDGLSHDIFPRVQPHIHTWVNKYGKNYLQWDGHEAEIVITELNLIKEVLNNGNKAYPKGETKGFMKKLLGDGLVTTEGEKWAKLRKIANHTFHGESLRDMSPSMISSVEMMLKRWELEYNIHEGTKEIEVFEEFRLLTSEVISKTAFGSSYEEGNKIFDMLMSLILLASKNSHTHRFPTLSKFIKTKDETEAERLEKEIHKCILNLINKREENVRNNNNNNNNNNDDDDDDDGAEEGFGSDFLGELLKAHHDTNDKQRISIDDLVEECKTFYVVGQETTNSLLGWTVFLLALHTDWQVAARNEMLNLFGHQKPGLDGIAKLKIMSMVINESLRLYPPVIGIIRKVDRETKLGNIILPSDVKFYISNLPIHHDSKLWGQDVHIFNPERFSQGIAKATHNNNVSAFFPFGIGPRSCVGNNFTLNQAKIALSMILQRYAFSLSPAYVHSPIQRGTLYPQHGVQIILQALS